VFSKINFTFTAMEAKNIRSAIESKGLKKSWVAKKLGVSNALVTKWVNGLTEPNDKHKIELKRLLN